MNKTYTENNLTSHSMGGTNIANPLPGEEVAITGISGTFPNSKNIYDFKSNLFNKVNMIQPNRRFDFVHPEIPPCSGTLPVIKKYDAGFFGVHEKQSCAWTLSARLLQEKAVEAIFDAGLHPSELEKTKTGVFIGTSIKEYDELMHFNILKPHAYGVERSDKSMLAHRLSYFLKLKGPSCVVDAGCSSSLFALEHAYRAIRLGEIDAAIVGGANLCLSPSVFIQYSRFGVLAKDGVCKPFDADARGYAKSEAICCVLLQKYKNAKRIYAQVVHAKTNSDGFKEQSITFPSSIAQTDLLESFYSECFVDRNSLSYLEAHGTGTLAGDPQECTAIDAVLTRHRTEPLLVGSVKSNMGHSEPASGICSLAKCIIALESGFIPPNINFDKPNKKLTGIINGRIKVVVDETPLDENGLIGISNFGFGGTNCHILLKWNTKEKINNSLPNYEFPILICVSGRTKESIKVLLDSITHQDIDIEFIALLHEIFRMDIRNHLYRGYTIVTKTGEVFRSLNHFKGQNRPLFFSFGELNNWCNIGCQLMAVHTFENFINRVEHILKAKNVDIYNLLLLKQVSKNTKINILGNIVVQLGILHIFKSLELKPINTFGFSFGTLLSAYCNDILTLEQTISCAFILNEMMISNYSNEECNKILQDLITNNKSNYDTVDMAALDKFKRYLGITQSKDLFFTINKISQIKVLDLNSVLLQVGKQPLEVENYSRISLFVKEDNYIEELLNCFGRLYEFGYNPQISKLYNPVAFPVSRGTRMISPYIVWNHQRDKSVPELDHHIEEHSPQCDVMHYEINPTDIQWAYVTGHVIDGKNIFPATSYLCLVWETFLLNQNISLNEKQVVFENCRFIRVTPVPKTLQISFNVNIQRDTGNFEVLEDDSAVVTGRISLLDDKTWSHVAYDFNQLKQRSLESECNMPMKSNDIYKNLGLRGYNYSGQYRGIQKGAVDFSNVYIKWENNWPIFLDNMLQLKILQSDSELLYVPTFISKIIISPKAHLNRVNIEVPSSNTAPSILVCCDKFSDHIRSYGVDISGIVLKSISRSRNLAKPILEKYKFVPNETKLDIYQSTRINIQIIIENSLTSQIKAVELVNEYTDKDAAPLTPLIKLIVEDIPLIEHSLKILSKYPVHAAVETTDGSLSNETDCLLIIASNILERKHILDAALKALRPNGYLICREDIQYDYRLIKNPDVSIITMHKTLTETLILLQVKRKTNQLKYVKITSTNDFLWIHEIQESMKKQKDVVLYSENCYINGILGLVNCLRKEPYGNCIRCVFLMDEHVEFDPEQSIFADQLQKNMAINVYKNKQWGTYRYLLLEKQNYVETEHSFLNIGVVGDLTTLKWVQGSLSHETVVPPEKMLVHVYYAALNFKDVLVATGKINGDDSISRLQHSRQGLEFSGKNSRGERVMGMVQFGALSSLVIADTYLTYKVPDSWSLDEAASVPVVYGTVLYALIISGRMKTGETILIHSGSGGVGQAAIRVALFYGCTVYVTVGTEAKRKFLRKKFPQIKDHQIGSSHNETFEQLILQETKGKGVDMVLNSLSNDKIIVSVRCLARGGRLLEIEISYHGIMVDHLVKETPLIKSKLNKIFVDALNKGIIQPIKSTIFKHSEIEESYRFMTNGKHIGKVLIQIRKPEDQLIVQPPIEKFSCISRFVCNPEKTYVIIGGLGGFGLELVDWLVLRGARKIVLNSRKGPSTVYQNMKIRTWKSYGTLVEVSTVSVITSDGCEQLIKKSLEYGPIDGIFNLAAILADSLFKNQSPERFKLTMDPKATVTTYLDKITRKMCPDLRAFVVFSSVACSRGSAGQTNYGMGNSVMERICEKRKKDGYPALAIQWGPVGEVGLVIKMLEDGINVNTGGTIQQSISSCLLVMDTLLGQKDEAVVSSIVVGEKCGRNEDNNIVKAVLNILGINNIQTISHYSTLAELGMDSLSVTEIKQLLRRKFEIHLKARELRSMTVLKLKEIEDKKYNASQNLERNQTISENN